MSTVFRPLTSGSTYRRWAFLILGGALLVPYLLAGVVLLPIALIRLADSIGDTAFILLILVFMALVLVASSFIPAVRGVEGAAVRELLGGRIGETGLGAGKSWPARWRATGWLAVHVIAGGAVSVATLFGLPGVVVACTMPFVGPMNVGGVRVPAIHGWLRGWIPVFALLMLVALVYVVAGVGAVLARWAPAFLGPSAAEQVAAVQQRAQQLAQRNRLARELHDSVGHALSVVSIQAGAAGRVLERDPDFARRALSAIEEAARTALEDLDYVLGLLREDRDGAADADGGRTPQASLRELDQLIQTTGLDVGLAVRGELVRVPPVVSREAYRIVQEGLTNALRHAGRVPVALHVVVAPDTLEITMTNPLGTGTAAARPGRGGRGLPGMRERVSVLQGTLAAGADGNDWRVSVSLPLHAGQSAR